MLDLESTRDDLVRFLLGYDGSLAADSGDSLYSSLLPDHRMGVKTRDAYITHLASLCVDALTHWEDLGATRRPQQARLNLLRLANALDRPDCLAAPLWRIYELRRATGDWLGFSLESALRDALVQNQRDSRLRTHWLRLVKGEQVDYMPGTPFDGYEGISRMPSDTSNADRTPEPSIDSIVEAVREVAVLVEQQSRDRSLLQKLWEKPRSFFAHVSGLIDLKYIEALDKEAHSEILVDCLPSLYVKAPDEPSAYYVWGPAAEMATRDGQVKELRNLCHGRVRLVSVAPSRVDEFDLFIKRIETKRHEYPFWKSSGVRGVVAYVAESCVVAGGDWLAEPRKHFLRNNNMPVPSTDNASGC